jgi:plasmid maintenance system antidote protein VapI
MSRNRLLRGLRPMHPGEMLREDVLPALGKSKAEIARLQTPSVVHFWRRQVSAVLASG